MGFRKPISNQIKKALARVTTTNEQLKELSNTTVGGLKIEVDSNKSNISLIQNNIQDINQNISNLQQQINEINIDLASLVSRIEVLELNQGA